MTNITLAQKRQIGRAVREHYAGRNARDVRSVDDEYLTVMVDRMPNTNKPGRIFAGYAADWLKGGAKMYDSAIREIVRAAMRQYKTQARSYGPPPPGACLEQAIYSATGQYAYVAHFERPTVKNMMRAAKRALQDEAATD